ncbi:Pex19p KNAG_0D04400 [Huiozyma naganishii CBS 8797]|uniref:Peroxin 19 n=1 Tax=Huiozyma naganishii (strain ATCC MYA-139 / BCRC 22969 / CBS 8797 / KCTC 17520 / NBRC 10181 / NCYC 3082 / Yp74L-3) TaxID=1071383 RepID=J7R5Q2_HUIN7|nr:hypothetical protein KNAG_0D04400 [Kazachstania naganishii CBS 8797]CCK70185.1 hypothetical protein KNAG_0D04400 [Kazachstania naganishii CBS 8797]
MSDGEYDDLDALLDDEEEQVEEVPVSVDGVSASATAAPLAVEENAPAGDTGGDAKTIEGLREEFTNLMSGGDGQEQATRDFDTVMDSLKAASAGGAVRGEGSVSKDSVGTGFQDIVADTLDKLKKSGDAAPQSQPKSQPPQPPQGEGNPDDVLSQLLSQLVDGSGPAELGEDGMDGAIWGILNQMSSREVLYEPMREMQADFVRWFDEHGEEPEHAEKIETYKKQRALVDELVAVYDSPGYTNELCRDRVTDLLDELEQLGDSPVSRPQGGGIGSGGGGGPDDDDIAKLLEIDGDDANLGDLDKELADTCKQQ